MDWAPIGQLTDEELGNGCWVALADEWANAAPVIRYLKDTSELAGLPDDEMKDWDGCGVGYYLILPDPPEQV